MFLTLPPTIVKGTEFNIQVSVPNLLAFSKVDADSYFNDTSNWRNLSVEFSDNANNQKIVRKIPYTGQTGLITVAGLVSSEFQDDELIFKRFFIYDKANGYLEISRSEISPQDQYDMEFV